MRRRLLAIVLAGAMVFSQSGAVLAAENAAEDSTAIEISAEEEPGQSEEETGIDSFAEEELTEAGEAATVEEPADTAQEEELQEAEAAEEEVTAQDAEEQPAPEAEQGEEQEADPEPAPAEQAEEDAAQAPVPDAENAAETAAVEGEQAAGSLYTETGEPYIEDQFNFGDRSMLPDWTQWIDRWQDVYVENEQYPEGEHLHRLVTDVTVEDEDGENVAIIESAEENGWDIRAKNMGVSKVTVTYTDWDDTPGHTVEFRLYVGGDVYNVDLWTGNGSDRVLRGGTVDLYASASHEHYDAETREYHNCSEEEMEGITYDWRFEIFGDSLRDVITLTQDTENPANAVISFENVPDDLEEEIHVNVIVSIRDGGDVVAENNYWLHMNRQYLELWPTEIDSNLDVGEEIIIEPEIREYSVDKDGYNVLPADQVSFEVETYDENAYTITEDKSAGTFTVKRLRAYWTSFRIRAFVKNENGDFEEVDNREYWLRDRNYGAWYDIDGNDTIYSDGSRTYGFWYENLEDVDFELIPEVGFGDWNEDSGFETKIEEGDGWTYNGSTREITFDGEKLYEKGIDHIETRIGLRVNGVEIEDRWEWRGFDVREARFDFHGAFEDIVQFVNETMYLDKQGDVYVESSQIPDGTEGTYTIKKLTYESEEDEFDTRDVIELTGNEYSWRIDAVRGGEALMHAEIEVQADGVTFTQERDFRVIVGGLRFHMDLTTSTGSDKLQTGGTITLTPRINGEEYDWETGEHRSIDTSDFEVRYEVRCGFIDQRIIDERYDGDYEAAAVRGELWDYTEDKENRSITLSAADDAYNLDLEIDAFAIDPENGEECAGCHRTIFVNPMIFALTLCEADSTEEIDWNEELPPGGEIVFTPQIMRSMMGEDPAPIGNPENVTYVMDWYAGDGDGSPGHFEVKKANGDYIYPGDQVTAADAPFTIKRLERWDDNFNFRAWWDDEEGNPQDVWKDMRFDEVNYNEGFTKNNERGGERFTWYYSDETIEVRPNRAELDALKAQGYDVTTTVAIGLREEGRLAPIPGYDPVAKGVFDEQNGLHASGAALEELLDVLGECYDDGIPRLSLQLTSELNGVMIADTTIQINIVRAYQEIVGLEYKMGIGTEQVWENGQAQLYIEDSAHDSGEQAYYETGDFFDITITDISLDNAEDQEFLSISEDGGSWKLTALKEADHGIPVTFIYTGGPEGYTSLNAEIWVSGSLFRVELHNKAGEPVERVAVLLGQTESLAPYVTRISYKEVNGEITEEETVLPADGFTYAITYDYYNDRLINIENGTGLITTYQTGSTDVDVQVRIYDPEDKECESVWIPAHVYVGSSFTELTIPEGAVFEAVPGKNYPVSEIAEEIGAELTVYSMKNPDGESYTVKEYIAEEISGEGSGVTLTGETGGGFTTLSVAGDAPEGTWTMRLLAKGENGPWSGAEVEVVVQKPVLTGWQKIDNTWYYYDENGTMLTGWQKLGGVWYYLGTDGAMVTGWKKVGSVWYYFDGSGAMVTGWKKVGTVWYYFDGSGAMATGWKKVGTVWYYFDGSGAMATGWKKVGTVWYYFNGSGAMMTGWQKIGSTWYYFNGSGAMLTGWQQIGGKWYYFNGSGAMVTGRQQIGGKWYTFSSSGVWQQ